MILKGLPATVRQLVRRHSHVTDFVRKEDAVPAPSLRSVLGLPSGKDQCLLRRAPVPGELQHPAGDRHHQAVRRPPVRHHGRGDPRVPAGVAVGLQPAVHLLGQQRLRRRGAQDPRSAVQAAASVQPEARSDLREEDRRGTRGRHGVRPRR